MSAVNGVRVCPEHVKEPWKGLVAQSVWPLSICPGKNLRVQTSRDAPLKHTRLPSKTEMFIFSVVFQFELPCLLTRFRHNAWVSGWSQVSSDHQCDQDTTDMWVERGCCSFWFTMKHTRGRLTSLKKWAGHFGGSWACC